MEVLEDRRSGPRISLAARRQGIRRKSRMKYTTMSSLLLSRELLRFRACVALTPREDSSGA